MRAADLWLQHHRKHSIKDLRCAVNYFNMQTFRFVALQNDKAACEELKMLPITSCCHRHNNCDSYIGGRKDRQAQRLLSLVFPVCICSPGIYYQLSAQQLTYSPAPLLQVNTSIMAGWKTSRTVIIQCKTHGLSSMDTVWI